MTGLTIAGISANMLLSPAPNGIIKPSLPMLSLSQSTTLQSLQLPTPCHTPPPGNFRARSPFFERGTSQGSAKNSNAISPNEERACTYGALKGHVEGLNVIIPMGGIGSRFQKEGYRFPKPLIKIVGRPMLCWLVENLKLTAQDTVWLAVNEEVENEFQLGQSMKKWFPNTNVRVIKLNYFTKGAAETLFIVAQNMPTSYRRRRTVSLDCDTIYFSDILTKVRKLPPNQGACFYSIDKGSEPIFSYITYEPHGRNVIDIQEKKAISRNANTGAYAFPSGDALRYWANFILDSKLDPQNTQPGEYYTSQLISAMIKADSCFFAAIELTEDDFCCVGTPRQLDEFLLKVSRQNSQIKPKKQRFCFDLDMTLVGVPSVPGDYSSCPPIWQNIQLVQALHKAGHYIIIQTARRMRTHHGNVGAVIADVGAITMGSLAQYGIPYHELVFGKPYAHIYVDDLAVNANVDTRREIGWLAADADADGLGSAQNPLSELKHAKKAGIIPSRDFNHVQIIGQRVIKSSKSEKLLAEMYFYSCIPESIGGLFPKLYRTSYYPETSTYSFEMQKLHGVSYSHLLIARSLTKARLSLMLEALHSVHQCSDEVVEPSADVVSPEVKSRLDQYSARSSQVPIPVGEANVDNEVDLYANYARKLDSRYHQYRDVYDALDPHRAAQMYSSMLVRLQSYEARDRAFPATYIHGDPVLSNAVLDETARQVSFFDVRAQQGDVLTTGGDICYDLAKVFQSLQGYDFVVLAEDEVVAEMLAKGPQAGLSLLLKPEDKSYLYDLQAHFESFVKQKYQGQVDIHELRMLVASLLFSLIPLHKPALQPFFLQMCSNMLEHEVAFIF